MTIGELPPLARVAFYACLLGGLALVDVLTDDWYGPVAVLVGFLFLVLPVFVRLFGRSGDPMPRASGRAVVAFAAVLTTLTAIEVALVPDFGLGAIFWIIATVIPALESLAYFTRREARLSS
jgi:hypothetical protein